MSHIHFYSSTYHGDAERMLTAAADHSDNNYQCADLENCPFIGKKLLSRVRIGNDEEHRELDEESRKEKERMKKEEKK